MVTNLELEALFLWHEQRLADGSACLDGGAGIGGTGEGDPLADQAAIWLVLLTRTARLLSYWDVG